MTRKDFILGTANFGHSYGYFGSRFTNSMEELMNSYRSTAFSGFDLALSYGLGPSLLSSLEEIGEFNTVKFKLSDLEEFQKNCYDHFFSLFSSLKYSNCLMLHNVLDLESYEGKKILSFLKSMRQEGIFSSVGVSIYSEEDLERVLSHFIPDVIQAPVNLSNRDIINSSILQELRFKNGVKLCARSIFMQGMLLLNPESKSFPSQALRDYVKEIHNWSLERSFSVTRLALSFVIQAKEVDSLVIGVNDSNQVKILSDLIIEIEEKSGIEEYPEITCADHDPRNWIK